MNKTLHLIAVWSLRLALAGAFLSAAADRFGWWGAPGAPDVAWGDWDSFVAYTGTLLWFLPPSWAGFFGMSATVAEIVLGIWLVVGWRLQAAALASATLLFSFGLTMTIALGVKAPLNYSVFTAIAAALALASLANVNGEGSRRNQ